MRLLIVEGDAAVAREESAVASELGFEVSRADDGVTAISELFGLGHARGSSLMLLDQSLPDGDAPSLIEAVKAQGLELPPFIVTTGVGDERAAVSMMRLGARDYLVKDECFLEALPQALLKLKRDVEAERAIDDTRNALQKVERRFRLIAENSNDIIFLYDPETRRFTYMSPSIARLWGVGETEALSRRLKDFLRPSDYEDLKTDVERRIQALAAGDQSRASAMYRAAIERPNGDPVRFEVLTTLFSRDDGGLEMLGVGRNVEERARMEESLTRSLREKEVLLKEVHHRVKNNLQIVTSLLNLQLDGLKDRKAAQALIDSQNRIRSMAMIHEQLYRSPNLNEVIFGDYIRAIVPVLLEGSGGRVRTEYRLSGDALPLDTAIPCGLILNELVTNAVKHAFTRVDEPVLSIEFGLSPGGSESRFVVGDNGPGFEPGGLGPNGPGCCAQSLGLTLVESLVGQIGGRLEIDGEGGARFTIRFPAPQASPTASPAAGSSP